MITTSSPPPSGAPPPAPIRAGDRVLILADYAGGRHSGCGTVTALLAEVTDHYGRTVTVPVSTLQPNAWDPAAETTR
jgi:hypothetical protein